MTEATTPKPAARILATVLGPRGTPAKERVTGVTTAMYSNAGERRRPAEDFSTHPRAVPAQPEEPVEARHPRADPRGKPPRTQQRGAFVESPDSAGDPSTGGPGLQAPIRTGVREENMKP